jgi:hypothetical protein
VWYRVEWSVEGWVAGVGVRLRDMGSGGLFKGGMSIFGGVENKRTIGLVGLERWNIDKSRVLSVAYV